MSDTAGPMPEQGSRTTGKLDRLLLEAGMEDDGGLRPVLLELQSLAAVQPLPSDAVAALMVPAAAASAGASAPTPAMAASVPPADELAARRRVKGRVTLTTLSLAVSLTAGGAVAAVADQGIRDTFGQLNHAISSLVAGKVVPSTENPRQPAVTDPVEPGNIPSLAAPTVPVPSGHVAPPATEPSSGAASGRTGVPAPAVPAPGITVAEDLTPGVPDAGNPLNTGQLGGIQSEDETATGEQLLPVPGTPSPSPAP